MTSLFVPYILAVMIMGAPQLPPQPVAPHEGDLESCQKEARKLNKQYEEMLKSSNGMVVCLEVKLPKV